MALAVGTGYVTTVISVGEGTSATRTTTTMQDGIRCTYTVANGVSTFAATDAEGGVLFAGPVTTPEQKATVPQEYRQRLEALETRQDGPLEAHGTPGAAAVQGKAP